MFVETRTRGTPYQPSLTSEIIRLGCDGIRDITYGASLVGIVCSRDACGKTTHYCLNIRTAGAGRPMRTCSLSTVCSCTDFSGDKDLSAVIVEYCMNMAWPPVRTGDLKS